MDFLLSLLISGAPCMVQDAPVPTFEEELRAEHEETVQQEEDFSAWGEEPPPSLVPS